MENTIEELLAQIEVNTGRFPEIQLKEIIERKDEATPLLINILKDVPNNLDKYLQPTTFHTIKPGLLNTALTTCLKTSGEEIVKCINILAISSYSL